MIPTSFATRMLVALLAGTAALVARADEGTVVVRPQWVAAFVGDVLADDRIAPSFEPSALPLADGGVLAMTVDGRSIVLRRYADDGILVRTRTYNFAGYVQDALLRAAASGDAFYVAVNELSNSASVSRFSADLDEQWTRPISGETDCSSCLRMDVLDDDSIVVMRAVRLTHIDSAGAVLWSVGGDDLYWQYPGGDVAVGNDTIYWAATSLGTTTLRRYSFDGTLLSASSSSCSGCTLDVFEDIEIASDGTLDAIGNSGSRGFYARFDAFGNPLLRFSSANLATTYRRIAHDVAGSLYLLAATYDGPEVRKFDRATGTTSWAAPASDFVSLDDGVATISTSGSTVSATSLDSTGSPRWSVALPASASSSIDVTSRPGHGYGELVLLSRDLSSSDDRCKQYPRVVRIDDLGSASQFDWPCRLAESPGYVAEADALAGVGVLVNSTTRITAFAPDGAQRWRIDTCTSCDGHDFAGVEWIASSLTVDGGAWAVRRERPSLASPDGSTTIEHVDAQGAVVASVPSATPATDYSSFRVLGTPQDAVVLGTRYADGLNWQRVRSDGVDLGTHSFSIPDPAFRIFDARRMPDDSVTVLIRDTFMCGVGCPQRYIRILRIAGNGSLMWQYVFPEWYAVVALDDVGGASAVPDVTDSDGLLSLRHIAPDGTVGANLRLLGVTPQSRASQLAGPIDGHWALFTWNDVDSTTLWLIDASGAVTAAQHDISSTEILSTSQLGYLAGNLVGEYTEDFYLLDPHTLAPLAQFYVNGEETPGGPRPWRVLDDGAVYGTIKLDRISMDAPGIARFSVPASAPDELIFRDGYD